jgi:MFS family permease
VTQGENLTYISATAIPRITSDFNSLNDIGWYGAAYLITQMSLLPTCGRFYTFYNVKYSYCATLLIFELGSIICAVAPNSITLIVGRAIAGVGAAGLMSGAAVLISYCVILRKRAVLMGVLSGVYGVGSVTGPLVGGVITDTKGLTWRFCFWINLREYPAFCCRSMLTIFSCRGYWNSANFMDVEKASAGG